jgi:dihydroxyacetone kinase-like protein
MSADAQVVAALLISIGVEIERAQATLDRLDAVAADGDHGATMVLGWRAVARSAEPIGDRSASQLLKDAGAAFAEVGGSIGPLWGTALLRAGRALDGIDAIDLSAAARAIQAGVDGMAERGRAREGDKTLLDVMIPAARELSAQAEAESATEPALRRALDAAADGLRRTADLPAARGRAKRLSERSRGHQDAGAASGFLIWRLCATTIVPELEVEDVVKA